MRHLAGQYDVGLVVVGPEPLGRRDCLGIDKANRRLSNVLECSRMITPEEAADSCCCFRNMPRYHKSRGL